MEILGFVDCPGWILAIIGFIASIVLYSKRKQSILKNLGVPGPKPALFFGIFPLYKEKGIAHTDLELVTKYGKVVGIYHGNTPNILIADPQMIEEICIKQFDNFKNRSSVMDLGCILRQSVALCEDTKWKVLREKMISVFSCSNVKETTKLLHGCIENMLKKIKGSSENSIDITVLCRSYSMDAISMLVFGTNINTHENPNEEMAKMTNKAWVAGTAGVVPKSTLCAIFPIMRYIYRCMDFTPLPNDVVKYFTRITKTAMTERQKQISGHRDLLKCMMACQISNGPTEKGVLNEDEIMANCIFFILAGYDTTANALAFLLYCLATNQKWQEKLIKEIDENFQKTIPTYEEVMDLQCLDMVTSETLRLYPPFLRFNRKAECDTCIKGHTIPRGMDVSFPVYAVHRNPELWPEPDTFDPERFSLRNKDQHKYSFIPFGCGRRNCFGMTLALLEVKLAVVRLLQNFHFVTSQETEIPPTLEKSGFLRPEKGIVLKALVR